MKNLFLFFSILRLTVCQVNAQDVMILHSKDTIHCRVIQMTSENITYKTDSLPDTKVIAVLPVYKILLGNGDYHFISVKLNTDGDNGWENVVIVDTPAQIEGLYRVEQLQSHYKVGTKWNIATDDRMKQKAIQDLKKQAAARHAQVLLITQEDSYYTYHNGTEANIRGIAYSYNPVTDPAIKQRTRFEGYQNR